MTDRERAEKAYTEITTQACDHSDGYDILEKAFSEVRAEGIEAGRDRAMILTYEAIYLACNKVIQKTIEMCAEMVEIQPIHSDFALAHDGSEKMMADKIRTQITPESVLAALERSESDGGEDE